MVNSSDTYQIYCRGYLSEDKIRVLTHLYQPIIRFEAFSLYLCLYHEINRGKMLNSEATHYRLLNICQMSMSQLNDALLVLEGIGLVRTYVKQVDDHQQYIYELLLPLTPKRFFSHEVLNTLLYRTLGENDYERTKYTFKIPNLELEDYQNITHRFDEVFHIDLSSSDIVSQNQSFEEDRQSDLSVQYDLNLFFQSLMDYRIPRNVITKDVENAIVSLGVVYHISPLVMCKLVYDVYDQGVISLPDLQERCLRYFEFENQTSLKEVQKGRNEPVQPTLSKREQKIQQLQSLSPYQYLQALQKGATPTSRDLNLIEKLMTEQKLNSGVVNVIVETVLHLNNGQLPKNHLEYLAGVFARKNVQTVERALEEAKTYIASRKQPKKEIVEQVVVTQPKKEVITSPTSDEELNDLMSEIQRLLKESE